MDLAEHVKTHMTQIEIEEEEKNTRQAEEARAQAIEREQIALKELEEGEHSCGTYPIAFTGEVSRSFL